MDMVKKILIDRQFAKDTSSMNSIGYNENFAITMKSILQLVAQMNIRRGFSYQFSMFMNESGTNNNFIFKASQLFELQLGVDNFWLRDLEESF